MNREVKPELLDELPSNDPQAVASRRDLQRVNAWMGHARVFMRWIQSVQWSNGSKMIVDLGAGDGSATLRVAQRLGPAWKRTEVILVDRQNLLSPQTAAEFKNLGWRVQLVQMDAFDFLARECPRVDVIMANLFLHHFSEAPLQKLLERASQQTRLFLACEPRRSTWPLLGARSLWVIGCNHVTRHDAIISVRAGFRGHELERLWPRTGNWHLRENRVGLFSHGFFADRVVGLQ